MFTELLAEFKSGNPYLLVMTALGLIGLAIAFERLMVIQFIYNLNFPKFLLNLKRHIANEDTAKAVSFCKSVKNTSLPYIARKSIEAAEADPTSIRGILEEEAIDFIPKIEARISAIFALSSLCLLIGILGSIDSLWQTFRLLGDQSEETQSFMVGAQIARSLNPAALGVFLSILLLGLYFFVRGLACRLVDRVNHGVIVLFNTLVPTEMGDFMPVSVASPMTAAEPIIAQQIISENTTPAPAPKEAKIDANFNDAAIEDIKDEEEII